MRFPEKEELKQEILNRTDILTIRLNICELKELGFSKEATYALLEGMRADFFEDEDDESEGKILELMDFVRGWCQQSLRIW